MSEKLHTPTNQLSRRHTTERTPVPTTAENNDYEPANACAEYTRRVDVIADSLSSEAVGRIDKAGRYLQSAEVIFQNSRSVTEHIERDLDQLAGALDRVSGGAVRKELGYISNDISYLHGAMTNTRNELAGASEGGHEVAELLTVAGHDQTAVDEAFFDYMDDTATLGESDDAVVAAARRSGSVRATLDATGSLVSRIEDEIFSIDEAVDGIGEQIKVIVDQINDLIADSLSREITPMELRSVMSQLAVIRSYRITPEIDRTQTLVVNASQALAALSSQPQAE